jgi:hypothetical protein
MMRGREIVPNLISLFNEIKKTNISYRTINYGVSLVQQKLLTFSQNSRTRFWVRPSLEKRNYHEVLTSTMRDLRNYIQLSEYTRMGIRQNVILHG